MAHSSAALISAFSAASAVKCSMPFKLATARQAKLPVPTGSCTRLSTFNLHLSPAWFRLMQRRKFLSTVGQAGVLAAAVGTEPIVRAATTSDAPKLRIGQFGTGHAHADGKIAAIRRSPDFELVGVVEPDPQLRRAAESRKDYAGVHWMSPEELLNTSGLKAVAVETQVKDLLPGGAKCIAAGAHVHLDKPAGESRPEFKRLLDEPPRKQLTVQMG